MSQQALVVRSVQDVVRIATARAEAIGLRREDIDRIAGLADGHAGKLMAVPPIKRAGPTTMFLLAGAVGLGIALVEDPAALKHAKREAKNRKLTRKKELQWRNAKKLSIMHAHAVERGKKGASVRMTKTTPEQRTRIARRAARARWRRLQAGER